MKTLKNICYFSILLLFTSFTSFTGTSKHSSFKDDGCGFWQTDQSSALEFRTCTDQDYPQFKDYQFFNGYNFQVHVFCAMTFTNGSSNKVSMYVDANTKSDKGSSNGRTISTWQFYKKQKQDDNGNWVDF